MINSRIKPNQNVDTTGVEIEYCQTGATGEKTKKPKYKFNPAINKTGRKMQKNKK